MEEMLLCIKWGLNKVCMLVCLSVCLSVSLYANNIVTLILYISCLTILLLLSKSNSCPSLHTGRPESAETSHFDGGNCHCYIWNLLGTRRNCAQFRQLHISQRHSTRIRCSAVNPLVYALVTKISEKS